jgi:phage gp36-like protein
VPAITLYATVADLSLYAINEAALADIDPGKIDAALEAASREVDSYIKSQYTLPLTAIGADLIAKTADIAAYRLMKATGYNPESPRDDLFKVAYDQAIAWLEKVGRGSVSPSGLQGSSGTTDGQAHGARPMVVSSSQRGFSSRGNTTSGGGFVGD